MSRVRSGMLVAFNMYQCKNGAVFTLPDEKGGLGLVLKAGGSYETEDRSFQVKVLYPFSLRGNILVMIESSLMPLAHNREAKVENLQEDLPEIILSLAREIDRLKKRVSELAPQASQV